MKNYKLVQVAEEVWWKVLWNYIYMLIRGEWTLERLVVLYDSTRPAGHQETLDCIRRFGQDREGTLESLRRNELGLAVFLKIKNELHVFKTNGVGRDEVASEDVVTHCLMQGKASYILEITDSEDASQHKYYIGRPVHMSWQ